MSTRYCPACGSSVDSADAYCAACGEALSRRRQPAETGRRSLSARIDELRGSGWTIDTDDGDRVVLVNREIGSVPAHLVLFLLTGGTGNVLYGVYRWTLGAPRRELRTDGTDRRLGRPGPRVDTLAAGVLAGLLLFVGVLVAFGLLLVGEPSGVVALLATVLAVTGLAWAAGVTDGFDWNPTRVGRERTVETESVDTPAEPCASCNGPVHAGERRTYADRTYLAGVPVRTHASGVNVYCQDCLAAPGGVETDLDRELEQARSGW